MESSPASLPPAPAFTDVLHPQSLMCNDLILERLGIWRSKTLMTWMRIVPVVGRSDDPKALSGSVSCLAERATHCVHSHERSAVMLVLMIDYDCRTMGEM